MIDCYGDIRPLYLKRCGEILAGLEAPVVLKTDGWNESRLDLIPSGAGPIIGEFPLVKQWVCVERDPERAETVRRMFSTDHTEVVTGMLQTVDFPARTFDAILCLGTLNHMGFDSARTVLQSFEWWLKDTGRLYLAVWLTNRPSVERDSENADERIYHNVEQFERELWETGFDVQGREEILRENHSQMLVGYKCGV